MSYPLVLDRIRRTPWLVQPSVYWAIEELLQERIGGADLGGEATLEQLADGARVDARLPKEEIDWYTGRVVPVEYFHLLNRAPGVAWVSAINGIVGKRLSSMEVYCGACSLDFFMEAMRQAAGDPEIETIIVDVNSPGGVATGVPEAGRFIRKIAAESGKQVIGFTDTKAYSAGQWLLAQCPVVVASPSAGLGSIGALLYWLDDTKRREDRGETLEIFEGGKHKAAGLRPITDEEREMFQAEITGLHTDFKAAILEARPNVPLSAMEGQTFSGEQGLELGLVDALVDTFDDALELFGLLA